MKRPEDLTQLQLADVGRLAVDAAIARRARLDAKAARNEAYRDWNEEHGSGEAGDDYNDRHHPEMVAATATQQAAYKAATRLSVSATQRLRRRLENLGVL